MRQRMKFILSEENASTVNIAGVFSSYRKAASALASLTQARMIEAYNKFSPEEIETMPTDNGVIICNDSSYCVTLSINKFVEDKTIS